MEKSNTIWQKMYSANICDENLDVCKISTSSASAWLEQIKMFYDSFELQFLLQKYFEAFVKLIWVKF